MTPITALILTCNEEKNIGPTLAALSWISEVVIVDSDSTDRTLEIARASHPNVRIVTRPFDTHAKQWNFGLQQVRTAWVLTLDADYQLSPELNSEIQNLNPDQELAGYEARVEYRVFGHPLRTSVYPPRVVLFRRERASYYDDGHTQRLRPIGPVKPLTGLIYHDDRKSLSHWLQSQDRYATLEARHLLTVRSDQLVFADRLRLIVFFAAPIMFFYLLFVRGLILDGWPGWFYVCQRTIAEFLLSIRLLIERLRAKR